MDFFFVSLRISLNVNIPFFLFLVINQNENRPQGWKWPCPGWSKLSAVSSFRTSCSSCGTSSWDSTRSSCCRYWPPPCSACAATTFTESCRTTPPIPSYPICQPSRWSPSYRWLLPSRAFEATAPYRTDINTLTFLYPRRSLLSTKKWQLEIWSNAFRCIFAIVAKFFFLLSLFFRKGKRSATIMSMGFSAVARTAVCYTIGSMSSAPTRFRGGGKQKTWARCWCSRVCVICFSHSAED